MASPSASQLLLNFKDSEREEFLRKATFENIKDRLADYISYSVHLTENIINDITLSHDVNLIVSLIKKDSSLLTHEQIKRLMRKSDIRIYRALAVKLKPQATSRFLGDRYNRNSTQASVKDLDKEDKFIFSILKKIATIKDRETAIALSYNQSFFMIANQKMQKKLSRISNRRNHLTAEEKLQWITKYSQSNRTIKKLWNRFSPRNPMIETIIFSSPTPTVKIIEFLWRTRTTTCDSSTLFREDEVAERYAPRQAWDYTSVREAILYHSNVPSSIIHEILVEAWEQGEQSSVRNNITRRILFHRETSIKTLLYINSILNNDKDQNEHFYGYLWENKTWINHILEQHDLPVETPVEWLQEIMS